MLEAPEPRRLDAGVRVDLAVHRPDGVLRRYVRGCENDITTDNWLKFQRAWWSPNLANDVSEAGLVDRGGTSRTIDVWDSGGTAFHVTKAGVRPEIALGDGNGAPITPARDDFDVAFEVFSGDISSVARASNKIAMSKAFVNSSGSSVFIREAALIFPAQDSAAVIRDFMMFYDSTDETEVPNNDTVTATYTITYL